MDLVWLRELAFSLDFRRVTRVLVKKGDEGSASVSERRGHLVDFLTKFPGSQVRESIYIYILHMCHEACVKRTHGVVT